MKSKTSIKKETRSARSASSGRRVNFDIKKFNSQSHPSLCADGGGGGTTYGLIDQKGR